MLSRRGKSDSDVGEEEEVNKCLGGFIINVKVWDGMGVGFKKGKDTFIGSNIRGFLSRVHGVVVHEAFVDGDEEILMTKAGWDRIPSREIGRGPISTERCGTKWGGVVDGGGSVARAAASGGRCSIVGGRL